VILERSPASYTKVFRSQGRRRREAAAANGNSGEFRQGRFANAALVGEKKRKETVRNLAEDRRESDQRT
jgi:hypothetical protein